MTVMGRITSRYGQQQRLRADFEAYLDGFSPNIQEVLEKFEFRNQIQAGRARRGGAASR